jgi:hypothetical protein
MLDIQKLLKKFLKKCDILLLNLFTIFILSKTQTKQKERRILLWEKQTFEKKLEDRYLIEKSTKTSKKKNNRKNLVKVMEKGIKVFKVFYNYV